MGVPGGGSSEEYLAEEHLARKRGRASVGCVLPLLTIATPVVTFVDRDELVSVRRPVRRNFPDALGSLVPMPMVFSFAAVPRVRGSRCLLGGVFASSLVLILLCSASGMAWAKPKALALPQRSFLPPVATINPPISPDAVNPDTGEEALGPVTLSAVSSPLLKAGARVTRLDSDLGIRASDGDFQTLLTLQRTSDEANLKRLWEATVEKNPVIRFSLEKLASPEELHGKQSSLFMRKTLNVLISGATIAATMMPGAGTYRNMGAMAGGDALRNVTLGNTPLPENLLSPTEKIQLAGMVDELQGKVIGSYHDYKNTLQSLISARQTTERHHTAYASALRARNDMAILATGSGYYKALISETALRNRAKLHRLELERLAGVDTVEGLQLSVACSQDLLQEAGAKPKAAKAAASPPASKAPVSPSASVASAPKPKPVSKTLPPAAKALLKPASPASAH